MASHHHCHPPATASSCCCHSCLYYAWYTLPPPDPLLYSTPSHFHHNHPPPPLQSHLYSPHLNPPPHEAFHNHLQQSPYHHPPTHQDFQHQPGVSLLLRRIAVLESSLFRRQISPSSVSSRSIRDSAARSIQTHFRAFLVRRSRTLRLLKDLASIKSSLNALQTDLSLHSRLDSRPIYRRAMNLLLKLDSIQGGDQMIRDGKRSISRDTIRFMEFIEGVTVKRTEISSRALNNVKSERTGNKVSVMCGDDSVLGENLRRRVEKIHGFSDDGGDDDEEDIEVENPRISISGKAGYSHNRNEGFVKTPAKLKKSVSFAENTNVYRVFGNTPERISHGDNNSSDGSVSVDNEREIVDNVCRGVEEIIVLPKGNEEANSEDGESFHNSDGGRNPRRNLRDEDIYEMTGHYQDENREFTFSAPLPVKMESRADLIKKRRSVKIVN